MLAFNSHADFVSALASYSHTPSAYQAIIAGGKTNGVAFGSSVASMVAIIPFMVLNYNGVLYSYYVGGELRRPGRTYLYASVISLVVLVVLWGGVWALLRAQAGLTFMQAQANLGAVNPTAYAKITSLSSVAGGLGYGMILSSNPIAQLLFATAVPLAEIAVNLAFVTVTTRVLFAQAFDRLLPVNVAKVGERNHAPNIAIAIVAGHRLGVLLADQLRQPEQHRRPAEPVLRADPAGRRRRGDVPAVAPGRPDRDARHAGGRQRRQFLRKVALVGAATTLLALFTCSRSSATPRSTASSAGNRS